MANERIEQQEWGIKLMIGATILLVLIVIAGGLLLWNYLQYGPVVPPPP